MEVHCDHLARDHSGLLRPCLSLANHRSIPPCSESISMVVMAVRDLCALQFLDLPLYAHAGSDRSHTTHGGTTSHRTPAFQSGPDAGDLFLQPLSRRYRLWSSSSHCTTTSPDHHQLFSGDDRGGSGVLRASARARGERNTQLTLCSSIAESESDASVHPYPPL